jgi:hypothetical protein
VAPRRRDAAQDARRFVQVAEHPSLGVETSTGRAWVGVDQQVGHGSADALFALTDDEYAGALVDAWSIRGIVDECWRGLRPERLLFHPAGGSWRPRGWTPRRARMLRQQVEGELWWHLDALVAGDETSLAIARALSGDTALVHADGDGVRAIHLRLVGEGAHPRPAAIVAGLPPGSDRARAAAVLGDPVEGDAHVVEGLRVRLAYDADGLAGMTLERPSTPPAPHGPMGVALVALGEAEEGVAFQALAALAGDHRRRWAVSSGHPRRLLAFADGVDVQVEHGRVLSVRIDLRGPAAVRFAPDATTPVTRAALRRVLGAPVDARGTTDLHRFGRRDLLVEHASTEATAIATAVTAVVGGVTVSSTIHRWRSGDFTLLVDVLGRPPSDPLVAAVRRRPGVDVRVHAGEVTAVEVAMRRAAPGSFVDGMPDAPTRRDVPLGRPAYVLERDDVWDLGFGFAHVHAGDGVLIDRIVVRRGLPPRLDVDRWVPPEDRGAWSPEHG